MTGMNKKENGASGSLLRLVIIGIMICGLIFLVSSPALADIVTLPLDQTQPGQPLAEENWTLISGADALTDERVLAYGTAQAKVLKYDAATRTWAPTEEDAAKSDFDWHFYEDPSISVRCEYATLLPACKAKKIQSSITYIRVANASQIRSAMSYDKAKGGGMVEANVMAKQKNAVAAVNGDLFKYGNNKAYYAIRQGEFYRSRLTGSRDVLLIDGEGNFSAVLAATEEEVDAAVKARGEADAVINTFTVGPVLVENGVARDISASSVAKSGEYQWKYAQQRVAVVQLDTLEYAIVEAYGRTEGTHGLTIQEFADYIAYLFPECRLAYNLDGGGSTNVVLKGERIEKTPGHRKITDILYFASAWQEE